MKEFYTTNKSLQSKVLYLVKSLRGKIITQDEFFNNFTCKRSNIVKCLINLYNLDLIKYQFITSGRYLSDNFVGLIKFY
jgi:hypothetical protein